MSEHIPYWRLSSFYFFYFAVLGALLPFWPLFLRDKGFDAEAIGYISGIIMGTKIVAPNIWGWLADRTGRRLAIIRTGALLGLVIFIGVVVDQSFWWLAIVVAGFSFFWNAVLAQFEVITLDHLGSRYQRYSQIRLWGSIGFIVAVIVLGLVFDYLPIGWLPWIVLFFLLSLWLSSLTIAERPVAHRVERDQQSFLSACKHPAVLAFFAICFLMQVSHGPYYTFFSVYLQQHGYDRTVTGLLWSLGVLADVLLFIVMHRLMAAFTLRQIMLASLLLSAVRWVLIALLVDNGVVLFVAQCLHAASFGSFHAFGVEMVRRHFAGGLQGQGMAMYSALSFGAGGAVGAVSAGWLWDSSPQLTFVLAAICCAVATVIGALWVKDR